MNNERGTAGLFLCAGILLFVLAYSGKYSTGSAPQSQFFVLAIWGYVFLVDNAGYWLSGASVLVSRTREMLPLALGSLAIACVFEILNLRITSWQYVNVPLWLPARWGTMALWWAALLPFIFVTGEFLLALGFLHKMTSKRFAVSRALLNSFYAAGIFMLALALLFPGAAGPMAFAAFFFLIEPVLFGSGLPSLLRELSWGLPGKAIRLAVSGILCALAWSGISTFLGAHSAGEGFIETGAVLESPFAAYAASSFFALEAYSLYSLYSAVRGGKTWEKGVWAMRGKRPGAYLKWVAWIAAVAVVYSALRIIDAGIR